jgi:glutamate formiminotransferase
MQIIECIPNFSEGRNTKIINQIASAITSVEGIKLLEIDPNEDANRTVITFAGAPENVVHAAFQAIKKASKLIDMRLQKGAHPRIGTTDVCPLVPLHGISMADAVKYAYLLAKKVGEELEIPVYCYENAAFTPERKNLAWIRKGEYENLEERMKTKIDFIPDFGKPIFNSKAGATVIGARDILIAYNFNLDTKSVEIAKRIAEEVRESGYWKIENGKKTKVEGKLKHLKAIGWYMEKYGFAQVSTNLTDFRATPLRLVYETITEMAKKYNTNITGSELVGLIPIKALEMNKKDGTHDSQMEVEQAVNYFGLNQIRPFKAEKKVLEYLLRIDTIL